jgi:protein-tyrosine-phosphatase/N-acetylglutamate synthase-like GNAT family acetyltransferase
VTYNVLFLCTGNTARSILAESILRKEGAGRFNAFSAGSQPKGKVNPFALKVLAALDYPTDGLRSKPWDEFAVPGAPAMDFVFTVCDSAAGEMCPIWPGQPMTAHWGIEDPAAVAGTDIEKERAFSTAARFLKNRIVAFLNLPMDSIDGMVLRRHLQRIGSTEGATQLVLLPIDGVAPELHAALAAEQLPVDDLAEEGRRFFRVIRGGATVGFAGYELHGDAALLRSIVVLPDHTDHGIGATTLQLLIGEAAQAGARRGYLITTSAAPFFEKLGFVPVGRDAVPEAILATRQAASLCPASAIILSKQF